MPSSSASRASLVVTPALQACSMPAVMFNLISLSLDIASPDNPGLDTLVPGHYIGSAKR